MSSLRKGIIPAWAATVLLAVLAGCAGGQASGPGGDGSGACARMPIEKAIADAAVAFVGKVTSTDGYVAHGKVQHVWRGDVADRVRVLGGPENPEPGVRGEGWHTFDPDRRYAFFPHRTGDGTFRDPGCSSTRPYTQDMSSLAPSPAHSSTSH